LHKASYIFFLTVILACNYSWSQANRHDSTLYKIVLKEYDQYKDSDPAKAMKAADKMRNLSLDKNDLFFLSDALLKKGVLYYYLDNYDSSSHYASRSLNASLTAKNYLILMRSNNLLGAICYNRGDLANAEKYYLQKAKIAETIKDTASAMGTYYNIGLVCFQKGDYFKSAEYNFKALDYFEQKKDSFNILASLHSIGFTYMHLEDNIASLNYLGRALRMAKARKDQYALAGIYIDISTLYGNLSKPDSSFYFIDQALKVSARAKNEFHFVIATNHKALLYLGRKNYLQAMLLAKEAEKLNLKADRKLSLSEVYETISRIYFAQNLADSALKYAYKAYYIGYDLGKANLLHRSSKTLSNVYEIKNNSDSALKFYKLYSHFNDTLKRESQLRGIAQREFLYEKQNQENERHKEQLLAETKLEKQKQINLIIAIASVLLLIFLVIGIINYRQKQKANAQVLIQKKLLEEKNKEVADSINYASRIQKSIMPDEISIKEILPNGFVLYLPKDIVSGDFYWINSLKTLNNKALQVLAVADCTGHGVPGAFMSLIGATILNQTLSIKEINKPSLALDFLNVELPKNIKGSSTGTIKDGMEICICTIDYEKMELQFSGANNDLYIIRNSTVNLYRGDKRPIGAGYDSNEKYTNHTIPLFEKDVIFMSTDGFPDQFGGPKGKKFQYLQMEEIFLAIHHLPVNEQFEILGKNFSAWKGDLDQLDDVLVMGIKI